MSVTAKHISTLDDASWQCDSQMIHFIHQ